MDPYKKLPDEAVDVGPSVEFKVVSRQREISAFEGDNLWITRRILDD